MKHITHHYKKIILFHNNTLLRIRLEYDLNNLMNNNEY